MLKDIGGIKSTFMNLNQIQNSIQIENLKQISEKEIFQIIASIASFKADINDANIK